MAALASTRQLELTQVKTNGIDLTYDGFGGEGDEAILLIAARHRWISMTADESCLQHSETDSKMRLAASCLKT